MHLPTPLLLAVLVLSNLLNYIDRGIIPGAANELNAFIQEALGPDASAGTVGTWFGMLVSAYIASYSFAAIVYGQLARTEKRPLRLVASGLLGWCGAAVLCGLAQPPDGQQADKMRLYLLLTGRILSGVGEAGFQCIVPGLIAAAAPPSRKALWMAALYTPIPVGTAAGYMIGAATAQTSHGWGAAFFVEAVVMLPIALLFCVADTPAPAVLVDGAEEAGQLLTPPTEESDGSTKTDGSLMAGVTTILSSSDFVLITLGYAAHTAVFAGLAAFGPTLILGLGFFKGKEAVASTAFGASVALGGAIGTPLGGWLSDRGASQQLSPTSDATSARTAERLRALRSMIGMIGLAAVIAMCTTLAPSEKVFLPLISLCVMCAYGAQASITMATLSCVTMDLQALAMSMTTLGIHIFGDVPSPMLIGLLKGSLAPHCVVLPPSLNNATHAADDDGKATSAKPVLQLDPQCADDRMGLRVTLAIVVAYLFTAVFWWVLAYVNARRKSTERKIQAGVELH